MNDVYLKITENFNVEYFFTYNQYDVKSERKKKQKKNTAKLS